MVTPATSVVYEFDSFKVDALKRLLIDVHGNPIPLKPKVFDTLIYFLSNSGRLVDKDELISAIWPDTIVEENNLNKNISALRRALGDDRSQHRFIVTIPGKGYKFVAEVRELASDAVSEVVEVLPPKADRRGLRILLVAIAIAVFAGVSFLGFYMWRGNKTDTPINSVAVLPFVNVESDTDLEYLADGLAETLIDRLSELPQLRVISRTSSFKYRDENVDLREVAQKLGVQAIVTGRVTRRGDDLSIRVELIDARDNKQLWGEQFNRKAADALAIEAEMARTVSRKLRLKLSGLQEKQLDEKSTIDPQAFDLVLKGDFAAKKSATRAKALEYYSQAAALDQNYALAFAKLAQTYQSLASSGSLDPRDVLPKVQSAVQRAIELDENLADAHLVLAQLAVDRWDWETAEREYNRTLELNPNLIAAHRRYSSYLSVIGRHEDAIAEAVRVKELDPQQVTSHLAVPIALQAARRFDESIAEVKKALELDQIYGGYSLLGRAFAAKGMYREAIAAFREAIRLGGRESYLDICLGAAFARVGDRENAQAIVLSLQSGKEYIAPGELAILFEAMGDREKAIETLEQALLDHDLQLQYLMADPSFDSMHGDPRFQDLVRRVGLP